MIFEVLKWDGRKWSPAGLLVGGPSKEAAWETLVWLGTCERESKVFSLRYAGQEPLIWPRSLTPC